MINIKKINNILVVAALLLGVNATAQNAEYKLRWAGLASVTAPNGTTTKVLSLQDAENITSRGHLPQLRFLFPDKAVASYTLGNAKWREMTKSEKSFLDTNEIAREEIRIKTSTRQRQTIGVVRITPFRRNTASGQLEKLLAFTPQIEFAKATTQAAFARAEAATIEPVLATGRWQKLGITKSGLYKIDAAMLRQMGYNLGEVDARTIRIFGNGGEMLPRTTNAARPAGLQQNAIWVAGEGDGRFDAEDYILFYAKGVDSWKANSTDSPTPFSHTTNYYADTNFYFVNIGLAPGLRVQQKAAIAADPARTFDQFTDHLLYEKELTNIIKAGTIWLGESFDFNLTQNFDFNVPGMVSGIITPIAGQVGAVSYYATSSFALKVGAVTIPSRSIPGVPDPNNDPFSNRATVKYFTGQAPAPSGGVLPMELTYIKGTAPTAVGYLDFLEACPTRELRPYSGQVSFRVPQSTQVPISGYSIGPDFNFNSGVGTVRVWDVTGPIAKELPVVGNGTTTLVKDSSTVLKEYVAFNGSAFSTPTYVGQVGNQNLAEVPVPQLLIVAPPHYLEAANRLADFRRSFDGLSVLVVSTRQIYNEFSSGKRDLTAIRDFARHLYTQPSSPLKYVLLLSDASFDFRRLTSVTNQEFIPIHEEANSFHPVWTWASDDYIGYLDDAEGNFGLDDFLDVGLGRLPVRTPQEALQVVDKLIAYSKQESNLGSWRNSVTFVADKGDYLLHLEQSEEVAKRMNRYGGAFNSTKLYLPAFPLVSGAGGFTSPEIRAAIKRRVEEGTLALTYSGHGSEFQWSNLRILDPELVTGLTNGSKLPFFLTATCEFGRLDDPSIQSTAELLVTKADGGGVGVLTACRPVYAYSNKELSTAMFDALFKPVNTAGDMPRLGDIFLDTKNKNSARQSNNGFNLLADPSLRLAYPKQKVVIETIADSQGIALDTLGALQTVFVTGKIQDFGGQHLTSYQGRLQATFFDKATRVTVNDIEGDRSTSGAYFDRKSVIFNGEAPIINGSWSIAFQLPRDINYTPGDGKMSFYAQPTSGLEDANGTNTTKIIVGGSSNAEPEFVPPTVRLFMNDTNFRNGGIVSRNATFLARVSDNSGINVSLSGIGHEMVGSFSFDKKNVVMNSYYLADIGKPRQGLVRYPLADLPAGKYNITFKVWDLHNNSSTASLRFEVRDEKCPSIAEVRMVPNPVGANGGGFSLALSDVGKALDLNVKVYDLSGKLVSDIASTYATAPSFIKPADLRFIPTDLTGKFLGNGLYIWRLTAKSAGNCSASQSGKLVINR